MTKRELIERIEYEYRRFEIEMMSGSKARIYERSGEIDSKKRLQNELIRMIEADQLSTKSLRFLYDKENILDFLYLRLVSNDNSFEKTLRDIREI